MSKRRRVVRQDTSKYRWEKVTIRDLVDGFHDGGEIGGVEAYGGNLIVRPDYQREFVYKGKQREKVIHSLFGWAWVGVFHWAELDDGKFELIDGQQRTISICQFVLNKFAIDNGTLYFDNLEPDEQEALLDYELDVKVFSGTEREKLEWFEIVNIVGEALIAQELRNSAYRGRFVAAAKRWFSHRGAPAAEEAADMWKAQPPLNRHGLMELAIRWAIASKDDEAIRGYMAAHQHDPNAEVLWQDFRKRIDWAKSVFPIWPIDSKNKRLRSAARNADWGALYDKYGCKPSPHPPDEMAAKAGRLVYNPEIQSPVGVFEYLLTGDEQHLDLRLFPEHDKLDAYRAQGGVCGRSDQPHGCGERFEFSEMHADHIVPWSSDGRTEPDNCQMLCRECNQRKGAN